LDDRPQVKVEDAASELFPSLGRWVSAEDLQADDVLLSREGSIDIVKNVESTEKQTTVYNLVIDDCQNFAVGENGILVHNS